MNSYKQLLITLKSTDDLDLLEKYCIDNFNMISPDYEVLRAITSNINCNEFMLKKIYSINSFESDMIVLQHINCPIDILDNLFTTSFSFEIKRIIRHENNSSKLLKYFYKKCNNSHYKHLIEEITSHPNWKLNEFE